jgi:hypothetical protein
MMFLKYLCCKDTLLSAHITTGEIKTVPHINQTSPMLEVNITMSMGGINPSTDFLYLQPQIDQIRDLHSLSNQ